MKWPYNNTNRVTFQHTELKDIDKEIVSSTNKMESSDR